MQLPLPANGIEGKFGTPASVPPLAPAHRSSAAAAATPPCSSCGSSPRASRRSPAAGSLAGGTTVAAAPRHPRRPSPSAPSGGSPTSTQVSARTTPTMCVCVCVGRRADRWGLVWCGVVGLADAVQERVRSWLSRARGAIADAANAAREKGRSKEEAEGRKKRRKEALEEQALVAVPEITVERRVGRGWLSLDAVVTIEQFARLVKVISDCASTVDCSL